jgi:hypothetical protein
MVRTILGVEIPRKNVLPKSKLEKEGKEKYLPYICAKELSAGPDKKYIRKRIAIVVVCAVLTFFRSVEIIIARDDRRNDKHTKRT